MCKSCYWAFPESYTHVATHELRRLDVVWQGKEVSDWERLRQSASEAGEEVPAHVKAILRCVLGKDRCD